MIKKIFSRAFLLIAVFVGSVLFAQDVPKLIFSDDFSSYPNGSDGSPVWHTTKGHWQIVDGVFSQTSFDYDCGAMLDQFIDYSFSLEVEFRVLDGEPGAGFFFHSEDYRTTEFSQMIRFESDESLLLGHFIKGEYEATTTPSLEKQDFTKWRSIKLVVNQDLKTFSFYLDGEPLAENLNLFCYSGYWGLQSSGGRIQFKNVKLYRLPTGTKSSSIQWPRQIGIDQNDNLLVPLWQKHLVNVLNSDGRVLKQLGAPVNGKPLLQHPHAVASLKTGEIVVTDLGNHRLVLFDAQGNWLAATGYKGNGREAFDNPIAVAVDSESVIFVADKGNNRIKAFDNRLKLIAEFGKKQLDKPVGLAVENGLVYVVSAGKNRVEIFSWDGKTAQWQRGFTCGAGECRSLAVKDGDIYLAVDKEVKQFNNQGELKNSFAGQSIGEIFPAGLAITSKHELILADFINSRLIFTNDRLSDPDGDIHFPARNKVRIEWESVTPAIGQLQIKQNKKIIFDKKDSAPRTKHQFTQKKLTPSTLYHYSFSPTLKMVGNVSDKSDWTAFISPPEKGKKHYRRLKLATIIFTQIIDTAKVKPSWPQLPPLPPNELQRIKAQIDDAILFYWMNSNLNLFIDMDYVPVDEELYRHQIFGQQWWYPPIPENIPKYLTKAGKAENDYQGIIYIACIREYDEKLGKYEQRGRGGGFTSGIQSNNKYGICYWEATRKHHNSGNNWLFVHEFHHQLDALFLASGYPEYWFCHFSPTINTAADFGEHFDGNAWLLRQWPEFKWYDLKYGNLEIATDNDEDGIPDDAPELPLDEKRLKSSPKKKDTDGDGVSDFDELKASNWVVEGLAETYATELLPDLRRKDTDDDGLTDDVDPYPFFPAEPEIRFGTPAIDGKLIPSEWAEFAKLKHEKINATVYANWDSSNLYIGFKMDRHVPFKLMLDADSDGWFIGRDNYWFKFTPAADGKIAAAFRLHNSSDMSRWPFFDEELAGKIDFAFEYNQQGTNSVMELRIPMGDDTGLSLESGEELGIIVGFLVAFDDEGHKRYLNIWEPNRFFDVKLVQ